MPQSRQIPALPRAEGFGELAGEFGGAAQMILQLLPFTGIVRVVGMRMGIESHAMAPDEESPQHA